MITSGKRVIDRTLLRINVEHVERKREGIAVNERVQEKERSEEAWYNGINRSTSQHHAAATVGETWNINQNIRTFEKNREVENVEQKGWFVFKSHCVLKVENIESYRYMENLYKEIVCVCVHKKCSSAFEHSVCICAA